ncbi:hypothetical protein CBP51_06590 [Cellvibrio mixtus]|uniref:Mutarotase n=1 Tax=Cellvibrio mixtus TaxID=39650 RepID=A0A266Q9Y7_9GAMM|nr:hypothetical protein [Cellvibrio mixtus]OZY86678.1 hypothetical protein CBP51_06590 [Cellvibrio mixtus]
MPNLKNIYTDMWINAEQKIRNGQHDVDLLIGAQEDSRRGITVLSYLKQTDGNASHNIMEFLHELSTQEPEQYYYPENELHLTVLSIISCVSGFTLKDVDTTDYQQVFIEAAKSVGPLEIHYSGITASPGCVLIQGFPVDEQLQELREKLRHAFRNSTLPSTIDSRYKIATAHSTVVRFQTPLRNHHTLLELLERYRAYDFGVCRINQLDLVFNNWYQHLSQTQLLASCHLR